MQRCDIRWRNMPRPPSRRRRQILNHHIMKPICAYLRVRSSHRLDPGSIRVSGFLLSKAGRPNASGKAISPNPPHRVNRSPLDPICLHHGIPASCGNYPYTPESVNFIQKYSLCLSPCTTDTKHNNTAVMHANCYAANHNLQSLISANKSSEKRILQSATSCPMTAARWAHSYIAI